MQNSALKKPAVTTDQLVLELVDSVEQLTYALTLLQERMNKLESGDRLLQEFLSQHLAAKPQRLVWS